MKSSPKKSQTPDCVGRALLPAAFDFGGKHSKPWVKPQPSPGFSKDQKSFETKININPRRTGVSAPHKTCYFPA